MQRFSHSHAMPGHARQDPHHWGIRGLVAPPSGAVILLLLLTALCPHMGRGADLFVSANGAAVPPYDTPERGVTSVAAAVAASHSGDRIIIGAGVFSTNVVLPHSLTLVGDGMTRSILDAGQGGSCIQVPAGASLTISDLTIRGGRAVQGGGIAVESGSLAATRIWFQDCSAGRGGGIYAKQSSVTVDEAVFERCSATPDLAVNGGKGGAVYLVSSPLGDTAHFSRCRFSGNRGTYGGAMRFWGGRAQIRESHFVDNRSENDVFEVNEMSSVVLVDCLFAGNQSRLAGIIAFMNASSGRISYCTITENESLAGYDTIYVDMFSAVQLWNSAFQRNLPDGLDIPFASLARGCVFSMPPARLGEAAAQSGPFFPGPDGQYYLGHSLAEASLFIGAGDPACPDSVVTATRKVYASGTGDDIAVSAGYGYPRGTTATLDLQRTPSWQLLASGSPLLTYWLEASPDARFATVSQAHAVGPLSSRPVSLVDTPLPAGTQVFRVRGAVPHGFRIVTTVLSPDALPLSAQRVDVHDVASGKWLAGGWTDQAGQATITNLPAGRMTLFAGANNLVFVPHWLGDTPHRDAALALDLGEAMPTIACEVTLGHGGTLQAMVQTDAGEPIDGAQVSVFLPDDSLYKQASTAPDGRTTIGGLADGTLRAAAYKLPDFETSYWQHADTLATATPMEMSSGTTLEVGFSLRPRAHISGTVYDPQLAPAGSIFVVAYDSSTFQEVGFTLTAPDGAYDLFVPAGNYLLSAGEGSDGVVQYSDAFSLASGDHLADLDFYLLAGGTIMGNIHLGDGTPAGDIFVDFYVKSNLDYVWVADAYVDLMGDYLSPVLEPGTYYVQAYGTPFYSNNWYVGAGSSLPRGVAVDVDLHVMDIDIVVEALQETRQ